MSYPLQKNDPDLREAGLGRARDLTDAPSQPRLTASQSTEEVIAHLHRTKHALEHINYRMNGPVPVSAQKETNTAKEPCLNDLLDTAIRLGSEVSNLAEHLASQI